MPKFTIVYNNKPINTYELDDQAITVGRLPENAISIPNMGISRRHIRIERDANRNYILTDLNSLNGTFVNNKKVKQVQLQNGDSIAIGKYTIIFDPADSVPATKATESAPDDTKQISIPLVVETLDDQTIPSEDSSGRKDTIRSKSIAPVVSSATKGKPTTPSETPIPANTAATITPVNTAVLIETNKHEVYKLEKTITTIGSSENDDVFINGFMIAQGQVTIEKTADGTWIRSQKLMGKFKVNGHKTNNVLLQHKDRIEIGSSTFRYMENESD